MRRLNKDYLYQKPSNNRSSKDLCMIIGSKSIFKCVSTSQLENWANREVRGALPEYNRRKAKRNKKMNKA